MSKSMKMHLALLLCLVLCLSLFPTAYAEEGDTEPAAEETAEADVVEEEDAAVPAETEDVIPEAEEEALIAEEETTGERQKSADGLPKLAAPSDLRWESSEYPCSISYKVNQHRDQYQFQYSLYKVGIAEPLASYVCPFGPNIDFITVCNILDSYDYCFRDKIIDNGSGDYYIGVRSCGDGVEYSDSDEVQTSVWHYEKPSASLPQLEKPTLNGITATVPFPADLEYATGVDMDICFSRTAEEEPYRAWLVSLTIDPGYHDSLQQWDINDACLEWNGPGYYSVRFRLLSKDITRYNDGPWSEWSEPSNVTEIQTELRRQLQQIAGNADGMSNDEIRASVQELNSYSLKAAMVTDQDNSGPVAAMAALDEKLGGTPITVAPEMNGSFGADEISVVGAQLNTPQAADKPIGFVLEKPKYNDVVPAMYNSSIAVKFSMDLENTNTGGMLAVPVKVTLPIPAGINPAFLAVLHYHTAGGEPEAIHPYVFQENGKYYASFVLSSFSDFIFTETLNDSDEAVAGFVRRGYSLILGRGADEGGLNYWMDQLKSGQLTGAGFVKGFLDSDEFRAKGASDTEVISIFYRVMMDREPDAGGMAYWMSILDKGVSYAYIINGFAASDEFGGICAASGITPGSVPLTEARDQNAQVTAFVNRNYLYALRRKGEPDGLNDWTGKLLNKVQTPKQVANDFVFSKECIGRGLNDRDFVEMLYHLYMGRDPDEGGLNYWVSELNAGTPREEAAAGFADSPEFREIVKSYGL